MSDIMSDIDVGGGKEIGMLRRRESFARWCKSVQAAAVHEPDNVRAPATGSNSRVDVIETEELTGAQRAAIIEVCVAAHSSENFRNLFNYTTAGARHFVGWRGDELVSHAMVTTRWLEPLGCGILRTAYVDAVSTSPAAQGLGCASAVMRQLAGCIGDYEIGCLQTDIAPFYERLGWRLWEGELYGRSDGGLIPTPKQRGVMVLALANTRPLDVGVALSIEVQPERIWE